MKIGFDQIGVPAPAAYRRLVNALIIIVVPATAAFITNIPTEILDDQHKIFAGLATTYALALLKALEFVIGTDDTTQPPK